MKEIDIKEATDKLLQIARDLCWNKISDKCSYVLSEIRNTEPDNFFELRKLRKLENKKKIPKTLRQITSDLKSLNSNFYDVNFYIYKSMREQTIIEIQYFLKSSLEKEFFEKVKDNDPMLHCKVPTPPYSNGKEEKFDINWELGGLRHKWKMFWWRQSIKKK